MSDVSKQYPFDQDQGQGPRLVAMTPELLMEMIGGAGQIVETKSAGGQLLWLAMSVQKMHEQFSKKVENAAALHAGGVHIFHEPPPNPEIFKEIRGLLERFDDLMPLLLRGHCDMFTDYMKKQKKEGGANE